MNVFRQELRMLRTSMIIWALVLSSIALLYISVYPAFSSDAEKTKEMFSHLPAVARSALNLNVDALLSFLGFFAFTFTNICLASGIYAMHTGIAIFSREHRSKTTDFLLTKPRSRTSLFLQKFGAGIAAIVIVWVLFYGASFVFAKLFDAGDFDVSRFGALLIALLIIEVWLYVFGLFLTQILPRIKSTITVALAATFGFFMVGMLGAILDESKLYYLSPFKFFNFPGIAAGEGYDKSLFLTAIASMLVFGIIAYVRYVKSDEKAVS